jgi:hypothetical protein
MLFAALTFWLFVIIFSAWAVHRLLCRLIKPKIVNALLLPGTLVAQLGHIFGLLVTGNEVRRASLMSDDEQGEPQAEAPDSHKIPILGSVVVGLLPILACSAALVVAIKWWGVWVFYGMHRDIVPQALPLDLTMIFVLLHEAVDAAEAMLVAIRKSDLTNWQTLLFIYVATCLTVRMAPFRGHERGAVVALALAGLLIWIAGLLSGQVATLIEQGWPMLSFVASLLLFLLVLTLLATAVVELVRLLARR